MRRGLGAQGGDAYPVPQVPPAGLDGAEEVLSNQPSGEGGEGAMIDEAQIENWFKERKLTPAQEEAYREVLKHAGRFARAVNENMPDGEDKAQVIQNLRQSILTVELAIRYRFSSGIVLAKGVQ
jgi:hypothetical protein